MIIRIVLVVFVVSLIGIETYASECDVVIDNLVSTVVAAQNASIGLSEAEHNSFFINQSDLNRFKNAKERLWQTVWAWKALIKENCIRSGN